MSTYKEKSGEKSLSDLLMHSDSHDDKPNEEKCNLPLDDSKFTKLTLP